MVKPNVYTYMHYKYQQWILIKWNKWIGNIQPDVKVHILISISTFWCSCCSFVYKFQTECLNWGWQLTGLMHYVAAKSKVRQVTVTHPLIVLGVVTANATFPNNCANTHIHDEWWMTWYNKCKVFTQWVFNLWGKYFEYLWIKPHHHSMVFMRFTLHIPLNYINPN